MFFTKQRRVHQCRGSNASGSTVAKGSASDLAVAVSLVSSLVVVSIPVRSYTAFVGEVGLLGELRSASAIEKRIQESGRMGFSRVVTPRAKGSKKNTNRSTNFTRINGIDWIQCDGLLDAINEGLVTKLPKGRRRRNPKAKNVETNRQMAPGTMEDLMLDSVINDDEDYDDYYDDGFG
jgi:hypothetical protein